MFEALADEIRKDVEIEIEDRDYILRHPIAHCAETNRFVYVSSKLSRAFDLNVYPGVFHELSFGIEVISTDGSYEPISTQERDIAANYIPASFRYRVVELVRAAYIRLIRTYRPTVVYRVTKAPASQEKGMQKHYALTLAIENEGYRVIQTGTDRHGRRFWKMEPFQR